MKRQTILLVIALLFANLLYGQNLMEIDSFQEKYIQDFRQTGILYFKDQKLVPGEPYQIYREATSDTSNKFQLISQEYDSSTEMTHYNYRQAYKGLKIEATHYKEHAENGYIKYANGKIVADLERNANQYYGRKEALEKLLMTLPNHKFAWESESMQNSIKNDTTNSDTTYYPHGELLWAIDNLGDVNYEIDESRFTLA